LAAGDRSNNQEDTKHGDAVRDAPTGRVAGERKGQPGNSEWRESGEQERQKERQGRGGKREPS